MKRFSTYIMTLAALTALANPTECFAKKKKKPKKSTFVPPSQPVAPVAVTEPVTSSEFTQQTQPAPIAEPPAPVAPSSLQQALASLNAYANLQTNLNVQTADSAVALRKAFLIADLLLDASGNLKDGLRSSIKSLFIPSAPREWEVNMGKVLDQLDSSWQPFFSLIKAPADANGPSALAIRALFSLDPSSSLTDRHAQVAVLSAMLSPYNQGPVGDCFAVTDMIRDHEEYYRHAAQDYRSIAMQGSIERSVNGNSDYFFFLPSIADEDRSGEIKLTTSGAFINSNYSLFDAPGFSAARTAMGGNRTANLLPQVLQILIAGANGAQITTTADNVIHAMAQVIATANGLDSLAGLIAAGQYAFSSLTNHPILRGAEAAYSAMAEDRPNDSTRGNINTALAQALQATWKQLRRLPDINQFQQKLTEIWNGSYRLIYNLDIPLSKVSADGSSSDGGFQLYARIADQPDHIGIPVVTPEQLRELVKQAVIAAEHELQGLSNAQQIGDRLMKFVGSDPFLKNFLWSYDPQNKQEKDPIHNYQNLARTPMQSCDGDNPFEVDDIDVGANYEKNVQTFVPADAKGLITWCLNLAKKAPAELLPMDSPQHAFNFVPANPDILAFLKKATSVNQGLQNTLITPGMQVSRKVIDDSTKQKVVCGITQFLFQALPDPSGFQKLTAQLGSQSLSVRDYSNRLYKGLVQLLDADTSQAQQIAVALDGVVINSLPAFDQAILNQSAIRFAFTNWNEGTEDIYFCAYFNPRTEAIGFGSIFEDKTHLQPMDETAWVNQQQWDVDLAPVAPVAQ